MDPRDYDVIRRRQTKTPKKRGAAIAKLIFWVCMVPYSPLARAYVLWWLWAWFVVPLGFSQLGMVHLLGLSWALQYFTWRIVSHGKDERDFTDKAAIVLLVPWCTLGIGWAIKAFM